MSKGPFGNCKKANLQSILQLQSYGAVLAIDKRSHLIVACSENINSVIGVKDDILGKPWAILLPPSSVSSMFIADADDAVGCQLETITLNGKQVDVSNHSHGDYCLVEFEPAKAKTESFTYNQRAAFVKKISKINDYAEAAKLLMESIAKFIGFDRAMLYKFLPDWHGEVIAEKLKPGVEGFLGLRFPEGDLPANARRIFTLNHQRLIADVSMPVTNIKTLDASVELDMTFSQLRAVHPVHIKYLENIGVCASFSVSIVCAGKLWGLIACHHLSAKVLSMSERQTCEELTRITAMHMNDLMKADIERMRYSYRVSVSEIRGTLNAQNKGKKAVNARIADIKSLFNADGVWHHFDGNDTFSGNVPDQSSIAALKNWLAKLEKHNINARSSIANELMSYPALMRFASGIIYIPLNNNDFIVLLRQEQVENVSWAGKPQNIDHNEESVSALTPRSSFQQWTQQLKGQCSPWHELDIETAEQFREELIDYLDRSEIEFMAMRDNLTGLANRLSYERKMEESIRAAIENDSTFAVFMIDLDNFKPVNDTLGHAAGDELLKQVSTRLSKLVRDEDTVARLGGDEFSIILNSVENNQSVNLVAQRIVEEIKRTFIIDNKPVQIGASIGVSLCPLDAMSHDELLKEADIALYEVKKSGRNGYKRFDKTMLDEQDVQENVRHLLENAFKNEQFDFTYQPIINVKSDKVESIEVFSVWHHPEQGLLKAADFMNLIERHQMTVNLVEWGLEKLFLQYQQWSRAGYAPLPFSLNLNAKQFLNMDIFSKCQELAQKYAVDTSWLRFDLDEKTLVLNSRRAEEKISQLAEIGVLINIDHFGQGILSLNQLIRLNINSMKVYFPHKNSMVDKSFKDAQIEIFKSISKVIKTPLVATKVESREKLNALKENNIPFVQGNAICEPLSSTEIENYLQANYN